LFLTNVGEYYSAKVWLDKRVTTRILQVIETFLSCLKILDARRVTWSQCHIEYPRTGATIKNVVQATGRAEFVHLWTTILFAIITAVPE